MRVVWNRKAEYHLNAIINYSIETFGERVAKRLYRRIKENDARLAANPNLGKRELLLEDMPIVYRSLVVHKHYKLIYHIEAETIYVAALFDTRRDPAFFGDHIK